MWTLLFRTFPGFGILGNYPCNFVRIQEIKTRDDNDDNDHDEDNNCSNVDDDADDYDNDISSDPKVD